MKNNLNEKPYATDESGLEFSDISDEIFREYLFPGGHIVRIAGVALNVSSSGGHRIVGADGLSHYVPAGWTHLRWETKTGHPFFAF